jgi:hypothetical protein
MSVSRDRLTVVVDDVFESECVVFTERVIRLKSVSMDGERLLLAINQYESNVGPVVAFTGITYCCPVPQLARINTDTLSSIYILCLGVNRSHRCDEIWHGSVGNRRRHASEFLLTDSRRDTPRRAS